MRVRLRPMPTQEELAAMYAKPHDHRIYGYGHDLRVQATISLARSMVGHHNLRSVADLSCGNGIIAKSLGLQKIVLGDMAPGYTMHGPLEETVERLKPVDLFICSETIEHLDSPEDALGKIRDKARFLVLSTPIGETDGGNPEHVWGWDQDGVGELLAETGWKPVLRNDVWVGVYDPSQGYSYQIWGCR